MIKKFVIFVVAVVVGLVMFFFTSISNRALKNLNIPGKLTKQEAMRIVRAKGLDVIYSWYQFDGFYPAVVVMTKTNGGSKKKVFVNAFSGKIMDGNFDD